MEPVPAPELHIQTWLNTETPLSLNAMRGKVVVLHAFQMLCPGCVLHGIPQMQRIYAAYQHADVAVIGLHCVFEHHEAMQLASLRAFVHEFRLAFPIGVDTPAPDGIPLTMRAYQLRGTPSLMLIDRRGRLRMHHFGQEEDLVVGTQIGMLLVEAADA
jgi:peroxiredoxin